jgi:hypothetical protein
MPAWPLLNGGSGGTADWFLNQLAVARLVLPDAGLDTIIGADFGETITTEIADVVGTASVDAADNVSGGAITMSVGDNVAALSSARLQLTGAGSHVKDISLTPWFLAALVKITQPLDVAQLAETRADAVALWTDADNWIAIGILGNASGGSTVRWVGSTDKAASVTTTLGPNLDPEEGGLWHLFQAWPAADGVHFAIDGQEFLATIPLADLPAFAGMLSPTVQRTAVGDPALVTYDKIAVFVASPTVGAA